MSDDPQTYDEMCTYIANWIESKGWSRPSNEAIWTMHPRGELYPVYELYFSAKMDREGLDMVVNMTPGPTMGEITWEPKTGATPQVRYAAASSSAADSPADSPPDQAQP